MAARHADATARNRMRLSLRSKTVGGLALMTLVGTALWAWPAAGTDQDAPQAKDAPPGASAPDTPNAPIAQTHTRAARAIPGLSTEYRRQIPADSRQVLVVTGQGPDSHDSTVVLYTRAEGSQDWQPGATWPAHNAARGWTKDHHYGDLRSPEGVFTLTDAGGKLPAPEGTKLSYDRNDHFVARGTGIEGEPLGPAFDYVIAIDYNRVPGSSPLDPRRPEGEAKGGGVWLHVDHDGPTQGCVSLKPEAMRELLRTLDPAQHPVIVMGPMGR
ncbi:L,D-transpeptidase family protein [Streptomyces sp. NPDC003077]|uniref:L,D-transpeptidase family protein n=1 Tax=Streptomyces sp. NPDC003077 TaxID=3154443 RepID=UPI0033A10F70